MAIQNVINKKSANLTIDPRAASDSQLQFAINSTNKFIVGVDAADDFYKMSIGGLLGSNDAFVMTDDGERTLPLQPAFLAELSSDMTNATGDNTAVVAICDTEIFDIGFNYNNTTGIFTAPCDGKYFFFGQVTLADLASGNVGGFLQIITSSFVIAFLVVKFGAMASSGGLTIAGMCMVDLDAADTAYLRITINGGTKIVDIVATDTRFGGYLAL